MKDAKENCDFKNRCGKSKLINPDQTYGSEAPGNMNLHRMEQAVFRIGTDTGWVKED